MSSEIERQTDGGNFESGAKMGERSETENPSIGHRSRPVVEIPERQYRYCGGRFTSTSSEDATDDLPTVVSGPRWPTGATAVSLQPRITQGRTVNHSL